MRLACRGPAAQIVRVIPSRVEAFGRAEHGGVAFSLAPSIPDRNDAELGVESPPVDAAHAVRQWRSCSLTWACVHCLQQHTALERTKELAATLEEGLIPLRWSCGGGTCGDEGVIGFSILVLVRGRAQVMANAVQLRIEWPLLLAWMRESVKARVTRELDVYLYPLDDGPSHDGNGTAA